MVSDTIVQEAVMAQQERLLRIQQAWLAYYGKLPKPLKVKPGQQDDNIRLSYGRLIVDKGVSFLFGDELDMDANSGTSVEDADIRCRSLTGP